MCARVIYIKDVCLISSYFLVFWTKLKLKSKILVLLKRTRGKIKLELLICFLSPSDHLLQPCKQCGWRKEVYVQNYLLPFQRNRKKKNFYREETQVKLNCILVIFCVSWEMLAVKLLLCLLPKSSVEVLVLSKERTRHQWQF